MPEPVNPSLQMPGYSAGTSQPGVAKKLIARAQRGDGVAQASVARANRMFRLKNGGAGEQPEARLPSRDIRSVEEVTRGLGLDSQRAQQVQTLVGETRADGGAKSQTHRIFLGLDRLNTTLRAMRDVPSETRMEIARRARALWMNTQQTDYGKEPTVRAPLRPQAREDLTMKKSQRFVVGAESFMGEREPLVKKMGPPTKGGKAPTKGGKTPTRAGTVAAKPAKAKTETWSQKRERELNEAYSAKQAAAKQAKAEAKQAAKAAPKGTPQKGPPQAAPQAGPPQAPAGAQKPAAPPQGPPQGAAPAKPQGAPQKPAASSAGPKEDIFAAAAERTAPKPAAAGAKPAPADAMGGADESGAQGTVSLNTPPPGFTAIPNSKKGGYHKQQGTGWVYWYPGVGITTTAMGEDKAGPGAQGAEGAAPPAKGAPPAAGPGKAAAGAQGAPQKPASVLGMGGAAAGAKKPAAGPQGGAQPGAAPGQGGDKEAHRAAHEKHVAAARAAFDAGDTEKGEAHRAAAEHHRHSFNQLSYAEHGQVWNRGKPAPPLPDQFAQQAEMGASEDPIADSYNRAQSGVVAGEDGERQTAAEPRQRQIPESETVKGMREALGKSVNVLADLSAAHDHLSALKAKKKQIAASGHPLARRLISQCDAEIAATRHDIVQLEDAHGQSMKEVAKWQSQMRSEQIKANPIFRALMGAFASLAGMGKKLMGGAKGKGAEDEQAQGEGEQPAAIGEEDADEEGLTPNEFGATPGGPKASALDLATHRAKALGAKEDEGEFDVSGAAKEHARSQALAAGASPDVLDALAAREGGPQRGTRDDKAANMQRVLAVLGEQSGGTSGVSAPENVEGEPEAPEGESEAASAIASLPTDMPGAPKPAKAGPKDIEEDTGQWDRDLAEKKAKVRAAEQEEDEALAPYADMDTMSRLKAFGFGAPGGSDDTERATRSEQSTRAKSGVAAKPERGTVATGPKKRKTPPMSEAQKSLIVDASERLVKSRAAARILHLAPRVDAMLKSASAPRLVLDRRPRTEHFFALYSSRV